MGGWVGETQSRLTLFIAGLEHMARQKTVAISPKPCTRALRIGFLPGILLSVGLQLGTAHAEPPGWETNFGPALPSLTGADDAVEQVSLGFSFPLDGILYSDIWVDTNGNIALAAASSNFPAVAVLLADQPRIAPFWSDLDLDQMGTVHVNDFGTYAVITWDGVGSFGSPTAPFTFQVQLFDDGTVKYLYNGISDIQTNLGNLLVGMSEGGGAADPGPSDFVTAPFTTGGATSYQVTFGAFGYDNGTITFEPASATTYDVTFDQVFGVTTTAGLSGTTIVFPGLETVLLSVCVVGDGVTDISALAIDIADISTTSQFSSTDLTELRLYSNALPNISGTPVLEATVLSAAVNLGGTTTIPFPAQVPALGEVRYFVVTAAIAAAATDGHAFVVGSPAGGLTTSAGPLGSGVVAADANQVLIEQGVTTTTGLNGTTTGFPGSEATLLIVRVVGNGVQSVSAIDIDIADVSTTSGFSSADITGLNVYTNTLPNLLGAPVLVQTVAPVDVNVGGTTTISFPAVIPSLGETRYFIVTAAIAAAATDGHAFVVGSPTGGIATSAGPEGSGVVAADANRVQIDRGPWLMGSNPGGEYFLVDTSTGAGTLLGLGTPSTEIEYDPISERAFSQFPGGAEFGTEIDPFTGAAIGATIPNGFDFNGLEYVGATLYGTSKTCCGGAVPSDLRILDPFAGTNTLIGPTGLNTPVAGLAYDEASTTMYGIQGGPGPADLVTIDLGTGLASVVGSTGIQAGSLEFGPDGLLYAGGSGGGNLYTINPSTGASTLVGPTGFFAVSGLALVDPPTPTGITESTPATGLPSGTTTIASGEEVRVLCIELTGDGVTTLDDLSAVVRDVGGSGTESGDFSAANLYLTPDCTWNPGDPGAVLIGTEPNVQIGTETGITAGAIVDATAGVAVALAVSSTIGHTFTVDFPAGGIATSAGAIGTGFTAAVGEEVIIVPAAPVLVPFLGLTSMPYTPTLDWSDVNGAVSYRLELDTDAAFPDPIVRDGLVMSGYTFTTQLALAPYFWRVKAFGPGGEESAWSAVDEVLSNVVDGKRAHPAISGCLFHFTVDEWHPLDDLGDELVAPESVPVFLRIGGQFEYHGESGYT